MTNTTPHHNHRPASRTGRALVPAATTSATTATNRYESRRPVRQRSAPSRTARAVSRARRDLRGRAKRRQQRSGASASPRASFVMVLCICFMNLLSMFTSYVRRRPYPSIRSQSTKVGSYATSQAFWCTRTLEEHDGARFAEGPECRRPSRTSSSAAAREIYKSASTVF